MELSLNDLSVIDCLIDWLIVWMIRIGLYKETFCFKHTEVAGLKYDSHLPKNFCFIYFNESPLKMMETAFYFILKAFLVLMVFKFLSRPFVGKTAWLERYDWFQNLWRHSLVNKQLQYTYYPISHVVKTTRQWNLVSL